MSRDYARNRLSTPKKKSSQASARSTGFAWLLIGILIGFMIGGIIYLKTQKTPAYTPNIPNTPNTPNTANISNTNANQSKKFPAQIIQSNVPENKSNNTNPKNIEKLQTQFDFYNVLPNQKAVGPTGDEDLSHIDAQTQAQTQPSTDNNPNTAHTPTVTAQLSATNPDKMTEPKSEPQSNTESDTESDLDSDNTQPKNMTPEKPVSQKSKEPESAKTQTQKNKTKHYILQIATLSKTEDTERLKAKLTLLGFDVQTAPVHRQGKTMTRLFLGPFEDIHEADAMHQQLQENMISSTRLKFDH